MKKSNGLGCLLLAIEIIVIFVIVFGAFYLLDMLQEKTLLGGEDWIFFEPMPYAQKIIVFTVVILLMEAGMALVYKKTGAPFMESSRAFMKFLWKYKIPCSILCIVLLFTGFTGISSVHTETVRSYDILHPAGRDYDYELISSVDTGFKRNGQFYYNIHVDGKTLKFSTPTVNSYLFPDYETETYKEFSDLDEKLQALGIPKNADTESLKYAEYDESCMQYLRKVVD